MKENYTQSPLHNKSMQPTVRLRRLTVDVGTSPFVIISPQKSSTIMQSIEGESIQAELPEFAKGSVFLPHDQSVELPQRDHISIDVAVDKDVLNKDVAVDDENDNSNHSELEGDLINTIINSFVEQKSVLHHDNDAGEFIISVISIYMKNCHTLGVSGE